MTEFTTWAIPLHCEGRLELSFTCLLSFTMFHHFVASTMPNSSTNPPLLIIYLVAMSALILIAILIHSWLLYLSHNDSSNFFNKVIFTVGHVFKGNKEEENLENALKILDKLTLIFYTFAFSTILIIAFIIFPFVNGRY